MTTQRAVRRAGSTLVSAALAVLLLAPAASGEESPLAPQLRTPGANESTLRLTIPEGVLPITLDASVATTARVGGDVVVLVEGREVARVSEADASDPEDPADISVPLFAEDATDGVLEVGLRRELDPTATGCPPLQPVTTELSDLRLEYLGEEPMPTSAEDFLPPLTSRIDVQIPRNADDEVIEAGLRAVAALGAVYPAGTAIRLGSPGTVLPRTGLGQRIVQLSPGGSADEDGEATAAVSDQFGIPKLELEGTGPQLAEAASALGADLLVDGTPDGAGGPDGTEGSDGLVSRPSVRDPQAAVPLGDLGLGVLSLASTGLASREMTVPQDLFGGPLDQLDLHVEGTHEPLEPGTRAQLSAYVNGQLVGSTLLDDPSGAISLDASVPGYRLRSSNRLRLSLATLPSAGSCPEPGTPVPVALDLDADASTVSGVTGSPLVGGLSTFPQVLGGDLRVAVRKQGQLRTAAAGDAARVVLALQQAAGAPVDVELVDADELIDGGGPGLLVSSVQDDAAALSSPLGLGPFRQDDGEGGTFGIGPDDMYAVLETSGRPDQPVLVLGSWTRGRARETEPVVTGLLDEVARSGWSSLDGTVLVVADDVEPVSLDLAVLGPPPSELDDVEEQAAPAAPWWLVPGIILLTLAVALQVVLHVRREQRLAEARDQAETDEGAEPEVSGAQRP